MIKSNHLAMLEHGTVYLEFLYEQPIKVTHQDGTSIIYDDTEIYNNLVNKYTKNPYSRAIERYVGQGAYCVYITTNLRVLVENGWMDDLKYICEPTEYHEKRYTFKVITSIGITREFNRHRTMSIAEQSTRYCNYSKDKFGGEVTFCIPFWTDLKEGSYEWKDYFGEYTRIDLSYPLKDQLVSYLFTTSKQYLELIDQGWPPQESREVLPLCTATEAVYTAFASDWQHFFDLRYFGKTGIPHPNMVELAGLMVKEAEKYGILDEILNNR
jgi:thymidylate synthase (FAD)